jgi:hypothetical protein
MRMSTWAVIIKMMWMLVIAVPMMVVFMVKGVVAIVNHFQAKHSPTPCYSSKPKNWIPRR